jgi:hypothetical protein
MYCLEAVIAAGQTLIRLTSTIKEAQLVSLGQNLALLPMTSTLIEAVANPDPAPRTGGFQKMPAGLGQTLAAWSAHAPMAYVEAEFFGGTGEQHAQAWDNGAVVLGPLHLGENEPSPPAGTPISWVLRRLGVTKGNHHDEFDAIGLGRCRTTGDWLRLAK